MGVCNSCNREDDIDQPKAANIIDERIKQIATSSVPSNSFHTPTSVAYSRSPYIDTTQSATTIRSFNFPNSARPSESARTSEVERFHFGPKSNEPGARPQSGVWKIPNQFSPLSSPSNHSLKAIPDVMNWSVAEVVAWWCEKLPDEAIQYAPLVEDTQLKGEDLCAMDLELLMSFQIDRPLAEHILLKIHRLMGSGSHYRNLTILSTSTTTTTGSHIRENTITSTTGETQVFSDPEGDSLPSYWKAPGLVEETDDENVNTSIRSPLTLLPPNSPRMNAEAEAESENLEKQAREFGRIAQLEKQIQVLQEQLSYQQKPRSPVGKRPNGKKLTPGKDRSTRCVAKGRRRNAKVSSKRRSQGKFAVYKEGPIDIGRITDWSPARYDIEDDGRPFLDERITVRPNKQNYHIYKEGPRDIGTVSDWKPYVHKREDSGRDFLAPRLARSKPIDRPASRKEGPRGKTEVKRKRSSLIRKDSGEKRRSSSRKNSGKRKSSSRKNSEKRKSVGRKNMDEKRDSYHQNRQRSPQDMTSLSPNATNFISADFRLLKMSVTGCGGEIMPQGV